MPNVNELIGRFENIAANPKAQLDKALAEGKKCIGVMPCFAPEELAYALDMLPFGMWGGPGQVSESKRYYPAFICSILHSILDSGIRGSFNGLSAVMVPMMCDAIKGMGANWKYGVKTIPVIDVPYAQNRAITAGIEFTKVKFGKILAQLEEIAGKKASEEDLRRAIAVYNKNRNDCMEFTKLAGLHPELINCRQRSSILKARYFMDRAQHSEWLSELNEGLENAPASEWKGHKVVTSGIIADADDLLAILDENGFAIAADQILHESVDNRCLVPENEDPIEGLAKRMADIKGTSLLFDPKKERAAELLDIAKKTGADGVIWVGTKFCDPEEFDYVPVRNLLTENDVRLLTIEIDSQTENFEQIRTAIETFKDII